MLRDIVPVSHPGLDGAVAKQGTGISVAATAIKNLDKLSLEVTRVSRQSLPETPSLDDIQAGILEVNPLAHTTAKPDAEANCGRAVQRVTLKGGYVTLAIAKLWS